MKTIEELVAMFNEQAHPDSKGHHLVNDNSGEYKKGKFCWILHESFIDDTNEVHCLMDVNYGHLGAVINGSCLFTNGQILNHGAFVVLDQEYYGMPVSIYKAVHNAISPDSTDTQPSA